MTWHLLHIIPAALCILFGLVCANEAAFNLRLGQNGAAINNGLATCVCWIAAAVSLWGALV